MENRASKFESATSDSINSEFFHEIFFRDKPTPLPGYSGKVGYREKRGSTNNFLNYVLRLMKTRYYPGSNRNIQGIYFYQTAGQDRIVRMYPDKVVWEPKYILDKDWDLARKRIEIMYDLLRKRWPLEKIQDHLMIKRKAEEFFDPHDLEFRHPAPEALAVYGRRLVDLGYPPGEVESYMREYTKKYFNL
jgi:hypothetical protein